MMRWMLFASFFLLATYSIDSRLAVPHLDTYSSIPWLYCVSEDRMCNILSPRNESTEISFLACPDNPFGQRNRNPLLSLVATGILGQGGFNFAAHTFGSSFFNAFIHFEKKRSTERTAGKVIKNLFEDELLLIDKLSNVMAKEIRNEGRK